MPRRPSAARFFGALDLNLASKKFTVSYAPASRRRRRLWCGARCRQTKKPHAKEAHGLQLSPYEVFETAVVIIGRMLDLDFTQLNTFCQALTILSSPNRFVKPQSRTEFTSGCKGILTDWECNVQLQFLTDLFCGRQRQLGFLLFLPRNAWPRR